jgi:hypothetical protein
MPPWRIFLLSPARSDGARGKLLLNTRAEFPLAAELRTPEGAPIGEVFSFLSGLYFRGKLAYARAFAAPPPGVAPALVITTDRGLVSPDTRVSRDDLEAFAQVDIGAGNPRFQEPLRQDAERLGGGIDPSPQVVLLGSIASGKYIDTLLAVYGDRLVFPAEFVGRGDMSRGGLMLRRVRELLELEYVPVAGAVRRGKRPPKLERVR